MDKDNFFLLGYISKKFGYKGELVFVLNVDDPENYKNLELTFIEIQGRPVPFFIENIISRKNNDFIVKIEDINSPEEAQFLIGNKIYLKTDSLPKLSEGRFYFHEIIGFKIFDISKGYIGEIEKVVEQSQQSLFQIKSKDKEILIPVVDDIILNINHKKKQINIDAPDGLIDLYL